MWYLSTWTGRSGQRGANYPTQDLSWAQELSASLNKPKSRRIRKFATRDEAFRAYYRILAT